MNSTDKAGIYIHIPFCVKKCRYCDFLSYSNGGNVDEYVKVLIREIKSYDYDKEIDSIFFGGGTPSLLKPIHLGVIIDEIYRKFDISDNCEITMEGNPGTITPDRAKEYSKSGINRFSMGVQTLDDRELKILGRIHSSKEAFECYDYIKSAGIDNINIDIMSAIPEQTIDSYQKTLEGIVSLNPSHISSYSLIVEEGTPFYEMQRRGELKLPDENTERQMYHMTKEFLAANGYNRYEISNYSKPEMESRHNVKYWKRNDYLGFGLGASSLVNGYRYNNTTDMKKYLNFAGIKDIREDIELLALKDMIEEHMYLGLRMMEGVSLKEFEHRYNKKIEDIYGTVINKLSDEKLLICEGDKVTLTDYGIDISNIVLAEFLLDILN